MVHKKIRLLSTVIVLLFSSTYLFGKNTAAQTIQPKYPGISFLSSEKDFSEHVKHIVFVSIIATLGIMAKYLLKIR